jgi:hypothetical protein
VVEELEDTQRRATELLQIATTISAIALALATLMEDRGPQLSGVYPISISLLFAGLVALAGSLLAIEDVREEVSGIESDWLAYRLLFNGHEALFFSIWALRLIGVTYFWLLVDAAP